MSPVTDLLRVITHQAVNVTHLFTLIRELITMAPAFTMGL